MEEKDWIFFYEDNEHEPEFEIKASNFDEAWVKAYDTYGPQVYDLLYKVKTTI